MSFTKGFLQDHQSWIAEHVDYRDCQWLVVRRPLLSQEEDIPRDNSVAKTRFEKLRVYGLAEEIADLA
jgi:hypothetical protein